MRAPVYPAPDWQGDMTLAWKSERIGEYTASMHGRGVYEYMASVMIVPEVRFGMAISVPMPFSPLGKRLLHL